MLNLQQIRSPWEMWAWEVTEEFEDGMIRKRVQDQWKTMRTHGLHGLHGWQRSEKVRNDVLTGARLGWQMVCRKQRERPVALPDL